MDLRELRLALRRHWVAALIAFDVVILVGLAAAYLPERQYTAQVELVAQIKPAANASPEEAARAVAFDLPTVLELVESRSAAAEAGAELPAAYRQLTLDVEAAVVTSVFFIDVTTSDPDAAASWALALGNWTTALKADNFFYDLVLVDEPLVPTSPSSPQTVPIILVATVLGLVSAVFVALVAGRVREAFDSTETIRERLGTSVLAEIPATRSLRRSTQPVVSILDNGAIPELVEVFQSLRTSVEIQIAHHDVKTIAITSFRAGEGKSTVSAGLAWSLAAVGHQVTMIDADLRRPALHHRLGLPLGPGLADINSDDMSHLVQPTPIRGLSFLPAGLPDGRPGDLVQLTLPRAISHLSAGPGLIGVDCPPIREVVETALIMKQAKYVILVVDASTSELPEIEAAVARLRESGAVLLGVVINRVRRSLFDRRSPYYGKTTIVRDA